MRLKNKIKVIIFDQDIIKKREKTNYKLIRDDLSKIYSDKNNLKKFDNFFITKFYEKKWHPKVP